MQVFIIFIDSTDFMESVAKLEWFHEWFHSGFNGDSNRYKYRGLPVCPSSPVPMYLVPVHEGLQNDVC